LCRDNVYKTQSEILFFERIIQIVYVFEAKSKMKKWDKELLILSLFCFALTMTDLAFLDAEHIVGAVIALCFGSFCIFYARPRKPVIDAGEGYKLIDTKVDYPRWDDEFWSDGVWLRRDAGTAAFSKGVVYRRPLNIKWDDDTRRKFVQHMMRE
jgi:hypothetical protein